jgi:hypothetical protein
MRRAICVLLACVILLAVPTVAMAATRYGYANTYFSNVNGWNFTLANTYTSSTSTQWKVTAVSLRAHLTADVTKLGSLGFYNTYGKLGPMYVKVKSAGTTVYSNQCSSVHTINRGGTSTHNWVPNELTKVNGTYGTATVYWTQELNIPPILGGLSSKNPATMSTTTY